MGKYLVYALILIGVSSLTNWSTLGRSAGSGYGGYAPRGGWIGGVGGFSSGGSGHK